MEEYKKNEHFSDVDKKYSVLSCRDCFYYSEVEFGDEEIYGKGNSHFCGIKNEGIENPDEKRKGCTEVTYDFTRFAFRL